MKIRVKRRTFFICWVAAVAVILALGIKTVTQNTGPAVQREEPQQAYILIHTLSGESWGFYGELTIENDKYGGQNITLDRAWIVGADHECYNPYAE